MTTAPAFRWPALIAEQLASNASEATLVKLHTIEAARVDQLVELFGV
jgi:hypothetical protein